MDKRTEDPDDGVFEIQMRVGGRNSGTRFYTLTLDLGPFDIENLCFEREPKWEIQNAKSAGKLAGTRDSSNATDHLRQNIMQVLRDNPFELTKSELQKAAGGNRANTMAKIDDLLSFGTLGVAQIVKRIVNEPNSRGRMVSRDVLGLPESEVLEPARTPEDVA
jgi:hypothetical protein